MPKRRATRTTVMTVQSVVIRVRGFDIKLKFDHVNRKPVIKRWRPDGTRPWSTAPLPLCGKTLADIYRTAAVILTNFNIPKAQFQAPQ